MNWLHNWYLLRWAAAHRDQWTRKLSRPNSARAASVSVEQKLSAVAASNRGEPHASASRVPPARAQRPTQVEGIERAEPEQAERADGLAAFASSDGPTPHAFGRHLCKRPLATLKTAAENECQKWLRKAVEKSRFFEAMALGLFLRSAINMGTGMLCRRPIVKKMLAESGCIEFQPMPFRAGLRDLDVYGHMNNGEYTSATAAGGRGSGDGGGRSCPSAELVTWFQRRARGARPLLPWRLVAAAYVRVGEMARWRSIGEAGSALHFLHRGALAVTSTKLTIASQCMRWLQA
jgi:hypothetical protein